jgi:hypothetical protein
MKVDVAPQPEEVLEDEDEEEEVVKEEVKEGGGGIEEGEVEEEEEAPIVELRQPKPKRVSQPAVLDKYGQVEKFFGFSIPRGKGQSVETIKDYVRTLANESQTPVNYSNLKQRTQWEDKLNQLVDNQYQLIQSGDAVNYEQRKSAVIDNLELPTPTNKLDSQKAFLAVLSDKLGKSYKKSDYTKKENVENRIKELINEHYKTLK